MFTASRLGALSCRLGSLRTLTKYQSVFSINYSVKTDFNTINLTMDENATVDMADRSPSVEKSMDNSDFSPNIGRGLPLSQLQLAKQLLKAPNQPANAKCLKVSIIGAPNAGKSTLTNMLLGWRISSTSSKVHTTRSRVNVVLTNNETQIVFLDTPGMTTPKKRKQHHLERSLLTDPHSSFSLADIVAVVVDVSKPWFRQALDKEVLKALLLHKQKRSILILNKIDELKSRETLLTTTRVLTQGKVGGKGADSTVVRKNFAEPTVSNIVKKLLENEKCSEKIIEDNVAVEDELDDKQGFHNYYVELKKLNRVVENRVGYDGFEEVFMVSAKDGEGVFELREYFLNQARPGDWDYHSDVLTDLDPHLVAQQCVWEKLMEHLPHEVPYNIDIEIVMWKVDEYGVLRIAMELYCYHTNHMKLLLGKGGQRIKQIGDEAKQELMNAFRCDLTLMLMAEMRHVTDKWKKKK